MFDVIYNICLGDREFYDVNALWEINKSQRFELIDDSGVVRDHMTLQDLYEESEDFSEDVLESVHEKQENVRWWLNYWQPMTSSCLPYLIDVSQDLIVREGKCRLVAAKILNFGIMPIRRV